MRKLGVSTQVQVVQKLRGMALPSRERAANDRQNARFGSVSIPRGSVTEAKYSAPFPRIL
jgi:hypothetical protein